MTTLRKTRIGGPEGAGVGVGVGVGVGESSAPLDLARLATIAYTSEDPAHPIEHLLDDRGGRGGSRWIAAQLDTTEQLVIAFDRPQTIGRLVYEVEETERERTQEIHVEVSNDEGRTYRRVLVQEYTFSPGGATFQHEDLRFELTGVTHLRFTIVPNKRGSGAATMTTLRLWA